MLKLHRGQEGMHHTLATLHVLSQTNRHGNPLVLAEQLELSLSAFFNLPRNTGLPAKELDHADHVHHFPGQGQCHRRGTGWTWLTLGNKLHPGVRLG